MKWQDGIISAGGIVLLIGLLPSVFGDQKPEPLTSFVTALVLYLFCVAYVSYKLWGAVVTTAVTATLWVILGVQAV